MKTRHPVANLARRLMLLATAVILIAVPGCRAAGQPEPHLLHEDAAQVPARYDYVSLLSSYSAAFDLLAQGSYDDLPALLAELNQANLPDEVRELFHRYNALSQELARALNLAETRLDEAAELISGNNLSEAGALLDQVQTQLGSASLLSQDISTATVSISTKLKVSMQADRLLGVAYDNLVSAEQRTASAVARLQALRQDLLAQQEQAKAALMPTELELAASSGAAALGEEITLSGRLRAGGSPLAQRNVEVALGSSTANARTDMEGRYQLVLKVPYQYVPSLTLQARYNPQGPDRETYQAAASTQTLLLQYYQTSLQVSLPAELHPGRPATLQGSIISDGPAARRTLTVTLGDTVLAQGTVEPAFSVTVVPPADGKLARYPLSVSLAPAGRYAGAAITSPVLLTRIPLTVQTGTRGLALVPGSYRLQGTVTAADGSTPVSHVIVTLPDGTSYEARAAAGAFDFSIRMPFDLAALGSRALTISVQPEEPWYTPARAGVTCFIFNPVDTGLVLLAALVLAGLSLRARRKHTPARPGAGALPSPYPAPAAPGYAPGGLSAFILRCYLEARKVVQLATGASLPPATTLREFLLKCEGLLSPARRAFGELTSLAESVLYGREKPGRDRASRANEYSRAVLERYFHDHR